MYLSHQVIEIKAYLMTSDVHCYEQVLFQSSLIGALLNVFFETNDSWSMSFLAYNRWKLSDAF